MAYKILVSQNAHLSHSIIWDYPHPIAIQGEFEAGREKLFAFLKQLAAENIFDSVELQRQIRATEAFLEKNRLRYAILECGEIYELEQTALEVQNQELFEQEILNIDDHLAACLAELGDMKREAEQLEAAAQQPPPLRRKAFSLACSVAKRKRKRSSQAEKPKQSGRPCGIC
ncbi:hypothetical protein EBQ34_08960 [Vandammella animalimorsus]|uniref:DUF7822 domain-containing protein n=1 Tax=Vandammella animalimorsus TaxID=2029117 RepID=A0A3M6RJV9_9BURK|nr:hypothetical protein [Vandammella animalimorsus]RMX14834.1 hypothetical protein EBQ34_08960 [Vandammella animalimorsus]